MKKTNSNYLSQQYVQQLREEMEQQKMSPQFQMTVGEWDGCRPSESYLNYLKPKKMQEEHLKDLKTYLGNYLGITKAVGEYSFFLTILNYLEHKGELFAEDIPAVRIALEHVCKRFEDTYLLIKSEKGGYVSELEGYYAGHIERINAVMQVL